MPGRPSSSAFRLRSGRKNRHDAEGGRAPRYARGELQEIGMSTWVVVLAGGVGSRFWPLSTSERPKQMLPLVSERALLEDSVHRLKPLVDPSRVLILTNATLKTSVEQLLPEVPAKNVIA